MWEFKGFDGLLQLVGQGRINRRMKRGRGVMGTNQLDGASFAIDRSVLCKPSSYSYPHW